MWKKAVGTEMMCFNSSQVKNKWTQDNSIQVLSNLHLM